MTGTIKEVLNARYNLLSETVAKLEEKIKNFPEGSIRVSKHKDKYSYYLVCEGTNDKYLRKNVVSKHSDLIQKAYVSKVIKSSRCEMKALKNAVDSLPDELAEEVYDNLSDARKAYAVPVYIGDDELAKKWMETSYDHLGFKDGTPEYITIKGERVRSKSEMIIADRLWANGIPYKYECPILVGNEIFHPDFTILKLSDNKLVYLEHCGMLDNPEYSDKMVNRINEYNQAGIYLGDRLFITCETSSTPLDVRVIDNLIKTQFR